MAEPYSDWIDGSRNTPHLPGHYAARRLVLVELRLQWLRKAR
jgi:hypothetical protein